MKRTEFDASASAVGYAQQFRLALLRALRLLKEGVDWQIAIEAGDDIEIRDAEGYTNYLQVKHRAPGVSLSNASPDLWKSLRIWSEQVSEGTLDLETSRLFLVTTASLPPDSAAAALSSDAAARNVSAALEQLNETASVSKNQANAKSYAAWERLGTRKARVLAAVHVLAESDDIDATGTAIAQELTLAAGRKHLDSFVARLEGWWFQKCINILRSNSPQFLGGDELDAYLNELRLGFLEDSLPLDPDVTSLKAEPGQYLDYRFTQQIHLVGVGPARIEAAVRDYYRAATQRSRWVREGLVRPDEIAEYESRLVEEWQYVFNRLTDELPDGASEDLKIVAAKEIYKWVEEATAPPIRAQRTDLFLIRGSLHILADTPAAISRSVEVGWHPDFAARLMAVLEPVTN